METKFTAKPVEVSGTFLVAHVDGVRMGKVVERFSAGKQETFLWEPERGYDSEYEVGFVHESGAEFRVYARYGAVRIGSNGNDELAQELAVFIKNSV